MNMIINPIMFALRMVLIEPQGWKKRPVWALFSLIPLIDSNTAIMSNPTHIRRTTPMATVASERAGNNLSSSYVAITKERVGEDIE